MPTQAVVHMVENGGRHTPREVCDQWDYLCRKGSLDLKRSRRYGEDVVPYEELPDWARSWLEQTGRYLSGQSVADSEQELTTHLVVPFLPPAQGTSEEAAARYIAAAEAIAREWTSEMFDSGRYGARWDYVTAFHTDRPHPHLHVVLNRESFPDRGTGETTLLRISHGNEHINWDSMREVLVDVARRMNEMWERDGDDRAYLIDLVASSRPARNVAGPSLTTRQYRQRQREAAARNFLDDAENAAFDFSVPPEATDLSAARIGQQGNPSGGAPGPVAVPEASPGPRRPIEADPHITDRIERWRVGVAAAVSSGEQENTDDRSIADQWQIDNQRATAAAQYRQSRIDEARAQREHEEQDRETDRRRTPHAASRDDPHQIDNARAEEAEQHRRNRAGQERRHRETEDEERDPARRRTPLSSQPSTQHPVILDESRSLRVPTPSASRQVQNEAEQSEELHANRAPVSSVGADNAARGGARRRRGDRVEHVAHAMETRGQQIRREKKEREERRRRRRGDDIERVVETRAQNRARLRAEAEATRRQAASTHPMELRSAAARQLRSGGQQGGSGGGDQEMDNSRPAQVRNTASPQAAQQGGTAGGGGNEGSLDNTRPSNPRTRSDRAREPNNRSRH